MGINRRSFLKGAVVAGGGMALALAGCGQQESSASSHANLSETGQPANWDEAYDVVVAGAGGGGLAAAVAAALAGRTVAVVEVMSNAGMSNSSICAGYVMACNSSVQRAAGIEDDVDGYEKYLAALAEGYDDPDIRRFMAEKSGETIDWLIEQGAEIQPEGVTTYGSFVDEYADIATPVARVHQCVQQSGAGYTEALRKRAEELGAKFFFNTQATEIVTDAKGEIAGLKAVSNGKDLALKANCGIVLNTGGFSRNPKLLRDLASPCLPGTDSESPVISSFGCPWQQGDGILMAMKLGAKLVTPWLAYNPAPGVATDVEDNSGLAFWSPALYVSRDGEMYIHASAGPYEKTMAEVWRMPGSTGWAIWDQGVNDYCYGSPLSYSSANVEDEVAAGYVTQCNTVEELAEAAGFEAQALSDVLASYNQYAQEHLGEHEFCSAYAWDHQPLVNPPYFLAPLTAVSPDTSGGVAVNTNAQVIDVFDEVIPRLYAVGNMTGGFKGKINAGCGVALGWTFLSGRTAGEQVAALEPRE